PVASEVVDTATHWRNGVALVTANCVITQRSAALSYTTAGSPSLSTSQGPPNPAHSVLPGAGPKTGAPVFLLNTAKDSLTHSTNCVAPAEPLVSGGAELTAKVPCGPTNPTPKPLKFKPGVVLTRGPGDACTTVSRTNGPATTGRGRPRGTTC